MSENLDSLQKDQSLVPAPEGFAEKANIPDYQAEYDRAAQDPDAYWQGWARQLDWMKPFTEGLKRDGNKVTWFADGTTNISHNCLERNIAAGKGDKVAFHWVSEEGEVKDVTFQQFLEGTNKLANGLVSLGLDESQKVTIYMPLVPETLMAMHACARIGATFSVVFGGFSEKALGSRVHASESSMVLTADVGFRRGKQVDLIGIARRAVADCDSVKTMVVLNRLEENRQSLQDREVDYHTLVAEQSAEFTAKEVPAEHRLFFLYTSGTTGQPKGVVHTHGGYQVQTYATCKMVFDLKDDDIFWCSADPGWITGHSYIAFGPMLAGATQIIAEGTPDYPDAGRFWKIAQDLKATVFYTAPTAVRMFMRMGDEWPAKYDLSSLRILGSVGEPINPEAWHWYYKHIGGGKCPIVDTWWQTETGSILLTTLPSYPAKPGSAGKPIPGLVFDVVDKECNPVPPHKGGFLGIKSVWPSMMRTIFNDHERYETYFNTIKGVYTAGDVATRDEDGYICVLGRADDVIQVAGHRIGTAEVESALVAHDAVAEAAVIGKPDDIKGERIKAFVILKAGHEPGEDLQKSLGLTVREELGAIAVPSELDFVPKLPKTRSGKIMRRVLKAQEMGVSPGDISTLED